MLRRILARPGAGAALLVALLLPGPAAADPLRVVVSLPPTAWLVERLGGERVDVFTLALPGESAETFQPTDRQVSLALTAQLFLRLGLPFEEGPSFAALAAQPGLRVVDLRDAVPLIAGHHHHGQIAPDPHHWLSPRRLRSSAAQVARVLAELDPAGRDLYEASCRRLDAELDALDLELATRLAPHRGRAFFVFHPEWSYFAADYGLRQVAVEKDGKEPSDLELTELILLARAEGLTAIFVPPQIASRGAYALGDALDAPCLPLDALAADLPATLRQAAGCIADALEGKKKPCGT